MSLQPRLFRTPLPPQSHALTPNPDANDNGLQAAETATMHAIASNLLAFAATWAPLTMRRAKRGAMESGGLNTPTVWTP